MEVFMNIRFFAKALLLVLTFAFSLQAKIDPRFLRGAYSNLQSHFQKFSLFHGVAAAPKIENQLLYNNDTTIGKLVKELFHQIQNQLTTPAALSRPASYLSLHTLGLLVATVHQNFPSALETKIKKTVTDAYLTKAENKGLSEKNKKTFSRDLAKIFELLKKGLTEQTEYDLYATLVALVYLKAGSLPDLEQYYQGLADGLNISVKDLFTHNDMIDDRPFSQQELVQQFNKLQTYTIDKTTLEALTLDPVEFEKNLASVLLINSENQSLPKPFDYQGGVSFETHAYPDCFETSIRNVLQALLFDSTTGICSLEKLRDYGINPDTIDLELKNFYQNSLQSGKHTINPCNPAQAGDLACHNAFSGLVSNRDWLLYSKGHFLRLPQTVNHQEFVNASGKAATIPSTMTHCSQIEVAGQKITIFQADSPLKLYELSSTVKNFIILLDQILQLGLFKQEEDALEKVFWRNDFETVYFDRLAKLFGWEYIQESEEGMKIFHIKRAEYYSFYIKFFSRSTGQPYHTEYGLEKNERKEDLTQINILEVAQHNQLFFNACMTGSVVTTERIKELFSSNPTDTQISDILYFCNMNDLNERLKIIEIILSEPQAISQSINLAQKLFIAQAPREDDQYQTNVIRILDVASKKNSFDKNSNPLMKFIRNDNVKKLLLLIGMLRDNLKFINLVLSAETTNKLELNELGSYLVQKNNPGFIQSLIELLTKYWNYNNNYLKDLCLSLLNKTPQQQAQKKLLEYFYTLLLKQDIHDSNKENLCDILINYSDGCELLMNFAQQLLKLNNPQACNLFKSLLTQEYSKDKFITFAQSLLHSGCLKQKETFNFFKLLVEHDIAFQEAAQAIVFAADNQIHLDVALELSESLLKKEKEINTISCCIYKLLKNNTSSMYSASSIFEQLFKHEHGFLEAAQCIKDKTINSVSIKKNLAEYIQNNKSCDAKIERIVCAAMNGLKGTQCLEALILFESLIKEDCAFYCALLAAEKAITSSDSLIKKKAFEILNELYQHNFGYRASIELDDTDPFLILIVSAAQQGIHDMETCTIDYKLLSLFSSFVEKDMAYDEAIKIITHFKFDGKKNRYLELPAALELLQKLVTAGKLLNEALKIAIDIPLDTACNYNKISLFTALVEQKTGIQEALNFTKEFASDDSLYQDKRNLFFILDLLEALMKKSQGFEVVEKISCHALLNSTDHNATSRACNILKKLLKSGRALASGEKVAIQKAQNRSDYQRGEALRLFKILVGKSSSFESAAHAAQQELDRKEHDKIFDNRGNALDLLKELLQQNYQPAYDYTFSVAMRLILDTEKLHLRSYAQECLKLLLHKGYLNQVKAFLAQFNREFPNKELKELADYITAQSALGKQNDQVCNSRIVPPEPKRQKLDQAFKDNLDI